MNVKSLVVLVLATFFMTTVFGVEKKPKKCLKCHGEGTVEVTEKISCSTCSGKGFVEHEVMIRDKSYVWEKDAAKSKKSKSRKTCPDCKRWGYKREKRTVECPSCNGRGEK